MTNRCGESGTINYNEGYILYKSVLGMGMVRCRWEPALLVLGPGEAMDCTDVVNNIDGRHVTRLQWFRLKREPSSSNLRR